MSIVFGLEIHFQLYCWTNVHCTIAFLGLDQQCFYPISCGFLSGERSIMSPVAFALQVNYDKTWKYIKVAHHCWMNSATFKTLLNENQLCVLVAFMALPVRNITMSGSSLIWNCLQGWNKERNRKKCNSAVVRAELVVNCSRVLDDSATHWNNNAEVQN